MAFICPIHRPADIGTLLQDLKGDSLTSVLPVTTVELLLLPCQWMWYWKPLSFSHSP